MGSQVQRMMRAMRDRMRVLLEPADDPRQVFATTFERQAEVLELVRRAAAELGLNKALVQDRVLATRVQVEQYAEQARQAVVDGRDAAARAALRYRQSALANLQRLELKLEELDQQQERLAQLEQQLLQLLAELALRLGDVTVHHEAAQAQIRLHQACQAATQELRELGDALHRAQHAADDLQAYASALDRLSAADIVGQLSVAGHDSLDRKLTRLIEEQHVEDLMNAVKYEVGLL